MNRPELVWIGAKPYQVFYDKAKLDAHNAVDRKNQIGRTTYRYLEIVIDDTMAEQAIRETLLHEVFHAVWTDAGLDEMEALNEEQIISALAPRLVLMLRANPDLSAYLLYRTPESEDLVATDEQPL